LRDGAPPGYTYECQDTSLLKPMYYALFVRPLARLLPGSVSANDVTFASQVCALIPAVIGLCCLRGAVPTWAWLVLAPLGFLGYIVFDHLDGAHARGHGTASPLGELVDHWCDAWNAPLLPYAACVAWGASPTLAATLGLITGLALCLAYQEQLVRGRMVLDRLGSTEAMSGMALSMVLLGVLGRDHALLVKLPFGVPLRIVLQGINLVGSSIAGVTMLVRTGPRLLLAMLPFLSAAVLTVVWCWQGLSPYLAPFVMGALSTICGGRVVLERTTGARLVSQWGSTGLVALGLAAHMLLRDRMTVFPVAAVVTSLLVLRAVADFIWGVRSLRRFVRTRELLALFRGGLPSS
jgi:phosphatidylglycerophosphate synthase